VFTFRNAFSADDCRAGSFFCRDSAVLSQGIRWPFSSPKSSSSPDWVVSNMTIFTTPLPTRCLPVKVASIQAVSTSYSAALISRLDDTGLCPRLQLTKARISDRRIVVGFLDTETLCRSKVNCRYQALNAQNPNRSSAIANRSPRGLSYPVIQVDEQSKTRIERLAEPCDPCWCRSGFHLIASSALCSIRDSQGS